jgi:hypothetical protein
LAIPLSFEASANSIAALMQLFGMLVNVQRYAMSFCVKSPFVAYT